MPHFKERIYASLPTYTGIQLGKQSMATRYPNLEKLVGSNPSPWYWPSETPAKTKAPWS